MKNSELAVSKIKYSSPGLSINKNAKRIKSAK